MTYLADTNILLRLVERDSLLCKRASAAIRTLIEAGETICICPQNLVEFWNGATRPRSANG
jgi:predicted nucleic acid-binding protein